MFILSLTQLSVYVLKQIDFTSQKEQPSAANVYCLINVCLTLTLCCLTDGSQTIRNLLHSSPGYKTTSHARRLPSWYSALWKPVLPNAQFGNRSSTVVKVLCYKSEGCWFDPQLVSVEFFIDTKSFRWGSTVVKVLCYKSEGRWFDPSWCQWIFHWHKIRPMR